MSVDEPIRVLVVDDQPLFRTAIATLIAGQPDLEVAGEAANGLQAVEMAHSLPLDLIVMDLEMPVMNGLEATRLIREQLPTLKVVILTVSEADDHLFERDGVKMLVDDTSLDLLTGAEVDYVEDLVGSAFQVKNPNASSSCGCGSSFAVA